MKHEKCIDDIKMHLKNDLFARILEQTKLVCNQI